MTMTSTYWPSTTRYGWGGELNEPYDKGVEAAARGAEVVGGYLVRMYSLFFSVLFF